MTKFAEQAGADASLQVCPYYNKPSQEGLFQHYQAIAEASALPIMLYSIPGRSVIEITVETQARLHEACPNIRAMKEAGGKEERVSEIRDALPDTYEVLSGDDALTVPFMARGAIGIVSVAANLIPEKLAAMAKAMLDGDRDLADKINAECGPLYKGLLGLDTNPVPIKEALAMTGAIDPQLRLPMVPLTDEKRAQLNTMLVELGIL
jgi:4-hydroxy-tetrahydrodipicolinate synthase